MEIKQEKQLNTRIKEFIKRWEKMNPVNFMANIKPGQKNDLVAEIEIYLKKYYGYKSMEEFGEIMEAGIYGKYGPIDKISVQIVASWFHEYFTQKQTKMWRENEASKFQDFKIEDLKTDTPLAKGSAYLLYCMTGNVSPWYKHNKNDDIPKDGDYKKIDNWGGILNFLSEHDKKSRHDYSGEIDVIKNILNG